MTKHLKTRNIRDNEIKEMGQVPLIEEKCVVIKLCMKGNRPPRLVL